MSNDKATPYRLGYADGSGAEDTIVEHLEDGREIAVAVTRWGCGCCQPELQAKHRAFAERIVEALTERDALLAQRDALVAACERALSALAWLPPTEGPARKQAGDATAIIRAALAMVSKL